MSLVTDMEVDGRVRGLYQIHERLGRGVRYFFNSRSLW